jgi:hypothetical protein
MKITINAAAVAALADRAVAALKAAGRAADAVSATCDRITATASTRQRSPSWRAWRAASWMDLWNRLF